MTVLFLLSSSLISQSKYTQKLFNNSKLNFITCAPCRGAKIKTKTGAHTVLLTHPPTLLPLCEVFEAIGGAALCLLVLLYMPWQLCGDVSDKVAAGPQTVIVASHSELAVLRKRHKRGESLKAEDAASCHSYYRLFFLFTCQVEVNKVCNTSQLLEAWNIPHF